MALEDWADELTGVWAQMSNGKGGNVKSYGLIDKREFPEKIEVFPSALSFIEDVRSDYSAGRLILEFWSGFTELHITKDIDKSNYPDLYKFFRPIRDIAAVNMQLNNTVDHFLLDFENRPSIQGPVVLQYGIDAPHLGLIINWNVKDNVSGEVQPSA